MKGQLPARTKTALVLSIILSFTQPVLSYEPLTDASISIAVAGWFENKEGAENVFGPIGLWDTSAVTNFDGLFQNQAKFNEDISQWDVSKVTSMKHMFAGCAHFNQPLNWDVSKVVDMQMMFYGATFFEDSNNSLQTWDVSSVTNMNGMFTGATQFQGDLSLWKPKKVESFIGMFAYAASFDPSSLNDWDVSSATLMDRMFYRAGAFKAELCWETLQDDVSGVEMLCGSSGSFDPDCENTNVPYQAEECPEAYSEREEEYEAREPKQQQEQSESIGPSRGGSGGVGAMNPGASDVGRDNPEVTARGEDVVGGGTIQVDNSPPSSDYDFEIGTGVDDAAEDREIGPGQDSDSIFTNRAIDTESSGALQRRASWFFVFAVVLSFLVSGNLVL